MHPKHPKDGIGSHRGIEGGVWEIRCVGQRPLKTLLTLGTRLYIEEQAAAPKKQKQAEASPEERMIQLLAEYLKKSQTPTVRI